MLIRNPLEQFLITDIFTINQISLINIGIYLIIGIILIVLAKSLGKWNNHNYKIRDYIEIYINLFILSTIGWLIIENLELIIKIFENKIVVYAADKSDNHINIGFNIKVPAIAMGSAVGVGIATKTIIKSCPSIPGKIAIGITGTVVSGATAVLTSGAINKITGGKGNIKNEGILEVNPTGLNADDQLIIFGVLLFIIVSLMLILYLSIIWFVLYLKKEELQIEKYIIIKYLVSIYKKWSRPLLIVIFLMLIYCQILSIFGLLVMLNY